MLGRTLAWLRFLLGLVACLALGYYATPIIIETWHEWFPPPEYTIADNEAFFANASTEIVLFSDSTCPWCTKTRKILQTRGVRFREYFIDISPDAMSLYTQLDLKTTAVPVLLVGERRFVGYHEAAFGEALDALAAERKGAERR